MNQIILKRSELVSIAVALVMLLAIGVFSGLDWIAYRQSRDEVLSARRVFEDTGAVLLDVTDAETGQRGYLLTGDPSDLAPYRQALDRIPSALKALTSSSADPRQAERINRLSTLVGLKLDELRRTVELRQNGDAAGATQMVRSGAGAQLMSSIRRLASEIGSQQRDFIAMRSEQVRYASDRAHFITLLGSATLLVLLALGAFNISAAAARREQLIADLEKQRGRTAEVRDLLQTTLASIGDAVLVTDDRGRVTFMNPVAESLTGWDGDAAAGRPEAEVLPLLDESARTPVESPVHAVLRTGQVVSLANHTVLVAKDGREIPVDDSGAPIRANTGNTLGVVVVFRDVTQRRAADRERERLLADAQESRADAERQRTHLHSLFQQAPAVINIHRGPEHVYELMHPGAKAMLHGLDVTGLRARDAGHDPEYLTILDEVYASGEPRSVTELSVRNDSWYSYICCPWRESDGSVAGVMTLAIDVTEQVRARRALKATEEQLRETAKLESLGVLAGGIAHDFNNLLVGIIGNASLALESLPAENPVNALIGDVLRAGERAATLTRQMLAYSGKGRFVIESVDFSQLVEEMLPLIQSSVPRTVSLRVDLDRGLPPVEGDSAQLHQVFMNLVINAAEACEGRPGGEVRISTSFQHVGDAPDLEPGAYVSLEVSDNGTGMDQATLAKIFDPFFTTKFTGRGLGLSAVLGIIRAHKGAVRVHSVPGQGSAFRVLFPAASALPSAATQPVRQLSLNRNPGGSVLLIDDEEIVRRIGRAALEQLGFRVLEAENGVQALDLFRTHRAEISLVILDLTMPVMSGEETLRRLRALDPEVKVILSSGFSEADATRHFEGRGLAGFLQKPYTLTRMSERVHAALTVTPR